MANPPSVLAHQATIADNPLFQKRVRQSLMKLALEKAKDASLPASLRKVAQDVLNNPEDWTLSVANGLATIVTDTAVTEDSITDAQINAAVAANITAYIPVA